MQWQRLVTIIVLFFLAEEAASSCTDTLTSHSSSEQDVPSERCAKRLKTSQQDDRVGAAEEQRSAKEVT